MTQQKKPVIFYLNKDETVLRGDYYLLRKTISPITAMIRRASSAQPAPTKGTRRVSELFDSELFDSSELSSGLSLQ